MPHFSLDDEVFFRAAEKFPTPFHLYDEQGIRLRARRLQAAFSWCGDFREYFAVKALPNPAVLRILKEEGCGPGVKGVIFSRTRSRSGARRPKRILPNPEMSANCEVREMFQA